MFLLTANWGVSPAREAEYCVWKPGEGEAVGMGWMRPEKREHSVLHRFQNSARFLSAGAAPHTQAVKNNLDWTSPAQLFSTSIRLIKLKWSYNLCQCVLSTLHQSCIWLCVLKEQTKAATKYVYSAILHHCCSSRTEKWGKTNIDAEAFGLHLSDQSKVHWKTLNLDPTPDWDHKHSMYSFTAHTCNYRQILKLKNKNTFSISISIWSESGT